jgi:hypothetical protein
MSSGKLHEGKRQTRRTQTADAFLRRGARIILQWADSTPLLSNHIFSFMKTSRFTVTLPAFVLAAAISTNFSHAHLCKIMQLRRVVGGSSARAGYASASGTNFEFNGSGVASAFLDTNLVTGLIHTNFNSNVLGRYVFQFRNGAPLGNP